MSYQENLYSRIYETLCKNLHKVNVRLESSGADWNILTSNYQLFNSCYKMFVSINFIHKFLNWKPFVFIGNPFLRWGFLIWVLILLRTFVLILVFFFSLRFVQSSPLAVYSWLTDTSDRNAESCNRIPSNFAFHRCCLSHHVLIKKPSGQLG